MAFIMRTSKPEAGNKFYNTIANGGYSTCIEGYPTDKGCNVLSNCVGYACGRFNEIIGFMRYPSLNCNAELFIKRAIKLGLEISDTPTLGGIMVWANGTESVSDGAGHVAIVERIDSATQIYTSESNYGGAAFFNAIRKNTNGRWGLGEGFTFIGCIKNPSVEDPIPEPEPEPMPIDKIQVGDWVVPTRLVNYNGIPLIQYDEKYIVTEINGDRAVLCADRNGSLQIWAAMNINDLKRVE